MASTNHPPPHVAVKERVDLYIFSPPGPSGPALGRTASSDLSLQNIHSASSSVGTGVRSFEGCSKDKNEWSYASSPPIRPHSMDRDSMFFTLIRLTAAEAFIPPSP